MLQKFANATSHALAGQLINIYQQTIHLSIRISQCRLLNFINLCVLVLKNDSVSIILLWQKRYMVTPFLLPFFAIMLKIVSSLNPRQGIAYKIDDLLRLWKNQEITGFFLMVSHKLLIFLSVQVNTFLHLQHTWAEKSTMRGLLRSFLTFWLFPQERQLEMK